MDPFGDHALTCTSSGTYRRHNRIRDTLFHLAKEATWDPKLEVTLPNLPDRPADILCRATFGKPLALDVTITHPLRLSASLAARGEVAASAELAEKRKKLAAESACTQAGWGFRALAFETTGGMGSGATQTIRQLCRQLSMKRGLAAGEVCTQVFRSLSLALAKGKGEMLAAAAPPTAA